MSKNVNATEELVTLPDRIVIVQNKEFSNSHLVTHGTSTRRGGYSQNEYSSLNMGLSTGDDETIVKKNREKIYHSLKVSAPEVVYAQQVHSNRVQVVDEKITQSFQKGTIHRIPNTDGLVTCLQKTPLAILTADCYPIFILDTKTPAIGLAHAGWRGTKTKISQETVKAMIESFGTKPENCLAWVSVGIGVCCYPVGDEVLNEFQEEYGSKINMVVDNKVNLSEVNRFQLEQIGIPIQSIFTSSYCTQHNADLFYSYRRDGKKSGRLVSVLMLN